MDGDQSQDQAGDQQDVRGIQPRDDFAAGVLTPEDKKREPGADQRYRLQDAPNDLQTGPREQVIRQGVAGEASGEGESGESDSDDPVQLTGFAERPGEEDAEHVHGNGSHEDECGPVVHLPDEQATANVETDVQRGRVRLGHVDAVERNVGALVDDLGHAGLVEEGEVSAGEEDHDEGVEGDLAKHEGPVLGENLGQVA